jgi:hypothetical protein
MHCLHSPSLNNLELTNVANRHVADTVAESERILELVGCACLIATLDCIKEG